MGPTTAPDSTCKTGSASSIHSAEEYFASLSEVLRNVPCATINAIADALLHAYHQERTVFLFGNGGSAALASHFACDLGKGTADRGRRKRFRVIALTDNIPTMTAWANDSSYDDVFAEPLRNLVRPGDVALAISGSGNSPNVVNALQVAHEAGALTIGFTGFQGGRMKGLCHLALVVPSNNMQHIEDIHLCVAHSLFSIVRGRLAKEELQGMVASSAG